MKGRITIEKKCLKNTAKIVKKIIIFNNFGNWIFIVRKAVNIDVWKIGVLKNKIDFYFTLKFLSRGQIFFIKMCLL